MVMADDGSRGPKTSVCFDREKLKAARAAAGLTQQELADKVELPRQSETARPGKKPKLHLDTVRRAERGEAISREVAVALSCALGKPLPELIRHAQPVYHLPGGRFERQDGRWIEYHGDTQFVVFDEFDANETYIQLICTRRRSEKGHRMLVRIPTKGGQIEWTWENPLEWVPFNIVKPKSP
jgi:transcriptional regulator with XRE-family HTH domain